MQKRASNKRNSFRNRKPRFGRRPFGKKKRFSDLSDMDPSKFVKKAVVREAEAEYVPQNQFKDFEINSDLKHNILNKGYETPTPIQDKTIPIALSGKNVLGIANTGTGKTASFLIPLINKVINDREEKVLIIAPTRELALQIVDELRDFTKFLKIRSASCIGGAGIKSQIFALKRSPNFVIGTPGRLKDLIDRRALNLAGFSNVVLDEVDRMLDMGFVQEIKHLLSLLPRQRQSLFFSATIQKNVEMLIKDFMKDYVKVSVKSRETSDNVDQDIVKVARSSNKVDTLHDVLIGGEITKALIFARTKRGVDTLSRDLRERGFKSDSIHGDKPQGKREKVLNNFKADKIQILVATDVAARGLDIPDISHVINYDLPANYDDYIHRIGRTGRANNTGKALTFVN